MASPIAEIERLSPEECYERVDKSLLVCQMRYVLEKSLFYNAKYKNYGIEAEKAKDIQIFSELPFTSKKELLIEQEKFPPFGRLATKNNQNDLRRVHITSGSSGKPLYIVLTEKDLAATVEAGRRAFTCAGLTSQDRVIHCLNYCLWAGGVTDHLNLESTGATVIPFGIGNSKNLVRTIIQLRPTAISCTPSYLSRLECVIHDEFSLKPPDLGLQKAFLGGEGGLQNPKIRSRIEDQWKIRAIDANYGMADVLSIFGSECETRQGLHFHGQGILYLELIDPETGKNLALTDGQVGEMVLTNLKREAQPLVRYKSGDLIKIVSTRPCDCGRRSLRFVVEGRTDDMIVVKGINIYPSAVANLLGESPRWFSGEFEFVLNSPPPLERPLLRVELTIEAESTDEEKLKTYLMQRCKEELQFTPQLELMAFGQFPRTEGKTKRVRKSIG
jgi:phenylacetate-CoA ligase